jgi:hypothetical protein
MQSRNEDFQCTTTRRRSVAVRDEHTSTTRPTKPPTVAVNLGPARTLHNVLNTVLGRREVVLISTQEGAGQIYVIRGGAFDRIFESGYANDVIYSVLDAVDDADAHPINPTICATTAVVDAP